MDDDYVTLRGRSVARLRVSGSRFIATAAGVSDRDAAVALVDDVRREHFDATHTAFAFRLGTRGEQVRAHDDGEPSGTAGKPILVAIERAGVTQVVVAVTRYFGGTKLGTGGLARAYAQVATQALAAGERETRVDAATLRVSLAHSLIGGVLHVASRLGAVVRSTEYDDRVHVTLAVPRSRVEELRRLMTEQTNGAAVVTDAVERRRGAPGIPLPGRGEI